MERYLLQQPKQLQCLSMFKIGEWITIQGETLMLPISELHQNDPVKAEALLSRQTEIIRNHLDLSLPRIYHDAVVAKTIRALKKIGRWPLKTRSVSQMNVIVRVIETLFSKNLTSLSLTCNTFVILRIPFCTKSYMLTGLTHLELNAEFLETDIILFLKELHSLIYLSVAYCTNDILRCIAKNCKLLEELDLCGESSVDSDSMCLLTELQNLRILHLPDGTLVGRKGVEILLLCCKNIERISINIPNITLYVLNRFRKKNAKKQLNLKAITSDTFTLQLVVSMCPLIQEISIYNVKGLRNLKKNLKPLIHLQNLRELKLSGLCFQDQVKEPLEVIGCNLVHLHLDNIELDLNAIIDISQVCQYLQYLCIDICSSKENMSPNTRKLENPPFRNLKDLVLKSSISMCPPRRTVPAFEEQIFFLLSNCLNVEFISIGCSVQLTEDNMLKVLKENSLTCLKKLTMWHYHNTVATIVIDHIIQSGSSYPEVIQFKQIF